MVILNQIYCICIEFNGQYVIKNKSIEMFVLHFKWRTVSLGQFFFSNFLLYYVFFLFTKLYKIQLKHDSIFFLNCIGEFNCLNDRKSSKNSNMELVRYRYWYAIDPSRRCCNTMHAN